MTLFVYGTLMRGGVFHHVLAGQRFLGAAQTCPYYALYDLGAYPGLAHCTAAGRAIDGELYEIPVSLIAQLDDIEGAPSLFRLEPVLIDGHPGDVFAYFYQQPIAGLALCAEDRWRHEGDAMTPDEVFLQAIRNAPEDDAPRLIYADWLEEHGQAERAEFIRIQCRLFGIPEADSNAPALQARAEVLLRNNWHAWISPLRELVGPKYDRYGETWMSQDYHPEGLRRFRRGFVDAITLDAERFLTQAKTMLELLPLRAFRVWGGGRCAAELFSCPRLAGLQTLAFVDYFSDPLTPQDARALAASPYVHGLRALYLGWNSLGDEGVETLTRARWLTSLATLDLSQNGLTDAAALALAHCPYLSGLQTLYLRRNPISSHGRTALASSPCLRHVTKLELLD